MPSLFEKQANKINLAVSCKTIGTELCRSYEAFVRSEPPRHLMQLLELLDWLERLERRYSGKRVARLGE